MGYGQGGKHSRTSLTPLDAYFTRRQASREDVECLLRIVRRRGENVEHGEFLIGQRMDGHLPPLERKDGTQPAGRMKANDRRSAGIEPGRSSSRNEEHTYQVGVAEPGSRYANEICADVKDATARARASVPRPMAT